MISTSFTWKDEYLLPYESHWSCMAKLCFLNGLTWSSVRRSATLKKFIRWPRLSNISMQAGAGREGSNGQIAIYLYFLNLDKLPSWAEITLDSLSYIQ